MRFLPLLFVVCYKNPIMIRASPILSRPIGAYPSDSSRVVSEVSASRQTDIRDAYKTSLPLDSSFAQERCSTADTGEPVLEIRRREIGTPRANTGDTPSTESTITYNQTNNETIAVPVTVLVIVAGPTTTQEVSSSVVDRSRPSVPLVAPALTRPYWYQHCCRHHRHVLDAHSDKYLTSCQYKQPAAVKRAPSPPSIVAVVPVRTSNSPCNYGFYLLDTTQEGAVQIGM